MKKLVITSCSVILIAIACNTGSKNETIGSDSTTTMSGSSSQRSKEDRNKQVVMESMKAIMNHDVDQVLKNCAANSVDYGDGSMKPIKGIDSIKAAMKMWVDNVQDYKGDSLEAVADGNKVMVYGDWSGTFKGDFMGMKTAGKKFHVKDVDYFKLDDEGKITEHRSVQSIAGLMASLRPGK